MRALGIINFEDDTATIDGLGEYRPVPAISFLGRYRIIDFILSNMTNSGIDHVQVYCKEKPRNLIEHLGSGIDYNINSKRGKLRILYGEKSFSSPVYNNDIANFMLNMQYIELDPNEYVIMAPSYFVYPIDFNEVLQAHQESGADITMLYASVDDAKSSFLGCDVITLDKEKRVTSFGKNHGNYKNRNISLEAYVMAKELFIDLCKKASELSSLYWLKDYLADMVEDYRIQGYRVRQRVNCLNSLEEYYRINMLLRKPEVSQELFQPEWPIYTRTNDSPPTRYGKGTKVSGSFVANGCVIEGDIEGCILGRNVKVHPGAQLKDCIILSNCEIGEDVFLDHVIVDKYAKVNNVKELKGTEKEPVYVRRGDRI